MYRKLLCALVAMGMAVPALANDEIIIGLMRLGPQDVSRMPLDEQLEARAQAMRPLDAAMLQRIEAATGVKFADLLPIAVGGRVLRADHDLSDDEMNAVLEKLSKVPGVTYAQENHKSVQINGVPAANNAQWDMYDSDSYYIIDANGVLNLGAFYGDSLIAGTTSSSFMGTGVTVAVVDSGYVPHPIFNNQLIYTEENVSGYQFISDCKAAGDTSSDCKVVPPQKNALDTGTYCPETGAASYWHGTAVTGLIAGGGASNDVGIVGTASGAKIVPVRVVGRCLAGSEADLINGMLWAGGLYKDIPNPNPAKVINVSLSLGLATPCSAAMRAAVTQIDDANLVLVAASGNHASDVKAISPAGCTTQDGTPFANLISVAAVDGYKNLASYSDWGAVTIAAAGGSTSGADQIYTSWYNSKQAYPITGCGTNCFNYVALWGTSYATPHVAGAAAALLSEYPAATPYQIKKQLVSNGKAMKNGCNAEGCMNNPVRLDIYKALTNSLAQ